MSFCERHARHQTKFRRTPAPPLLLYDNLRLPYFFLVKSRSYQNQRQSSSCGPHRQKARAIETDLPPELPILPNRHRASVAGGHTSTLIHVLVSVFCTMVQRTSTEIPPLPHPSKSKQRRVRVAAQSALAPIDRLELRQFLPASSIRVWTRSKGYIA
jgi:hypothetical protein